MKEDQDEQQKGSKKPSVKYILDNFRKNIFAIEYYFTRFESVVQGADEDGLNQSLEFFDEMVTFIGIDRNSSKEEQKKIVIPDEKVTQLFYKLAERPKISAQNYEILSRSAFLMLNNYFEYLLSDLLSYYYSKFQKSLNEKKFNIALKEINEFDSIEDLTKSLITKEVESMMVELSFDELLDHFQTKLEISNEKETVNWNTIIESRERRHLIVHNSSIVNKKYITRSTNPFGLKIGDTVHIEKQYFFDSCKEFLLAGILISYNSWGKWDKETTTEAIEAIMKDSFDFLKQHEYALVVRFTEYLRKLSPRNDEEEDSLMRAKFNRMIALKKIGSDKALEKELKEVRIGIASPVFKLAYAILSGKNENILPLIRQTRELDHIDMYRYNQWPIYDFVRSDDDLNRKIMAELEGTVAS